MRISLLALTLFANVFASHAAEAESYRITATGDGVANAVREYSDSVRVHNSDVNLDFLPDIARPAELFTFLEQGLIDIAVVPFETIPVLGQSPLLHPFLAPDAAGVRRAIDSEAGAFAKVAVERDTNLRVLDFWHVSSTILASSMPIRRVSDLQGLRVRSPSPFGNEVLAELGASQIPVPAGEIYSALGRGSLDSSPVPYDDRSVALGFTEIVTNYVDRLYKPSLYAVVVTKDRWDAISYPEQYALARAAVSTAEVLATNLDIKAQTFRQSELSRGAAFAAWNPEDVNEVLVASLSAVGDDETNRDLVELAYASASAPATMPPDDGAEPMPHANVEILFATDRVAVTQGTPDTAYSSSRKLDGITFGRATVELAGGRELGDDLDDTTMIIQVSAMSDDDFVQAISGGQQLVLYVHGYNNSYSDVVRRAATISADIAPNATIVSYTWPSQGTILSYGYDEQSTGIADQNYKILMKRIIGTVPAERISIIAHSMGSRLVLNYVEGLARQSIFPDQVKFQNLVFVASDVSLDLFKQKELNPFVSNFPISEYADQITVYSSQYDRALGLSKKLHGGGRPLGLADRTTMFLAPGITAIDASLIDPARWYQRFSFATRHSYVFDKVAGVRDLSLLLAGQSAGIRPGMTIQKRGTEQYWQLSP